MAALPMASGSGKPVRAFFRVIGNTKSLHGASQMARYVAFASRDLIGHEKGGFDREHDQANVKQFVADLRDPLTRHSQVPKAFHCLFSQTHEELRQCGITDWRNVVREVMQTYERESGKRLSWFAAQHPNPTHPHCHVIIKAVYQTPEGQHRKLRINPADLRRMRQITGRVLGYHRSQVRAMERAARPALEQPRVLEAYSSGLAWIMEQIRKERRRREEADRSRGRWFDEHEDRER